MDKSFSDSKQRGAPSYPSFAEGWKQALRDRFIEVMGIVADNGGYDFPGQAFQQCGAACDKIEERLSPIPCYKVKVKVEEVPEKSPWHAFAEGRADHVWHWVVVVPGVGVGDATGAQLLRQPVRLLTSVPDAWSLVQTVKPSSTAVDPVDLHPQLCSGDPVRAKWAMNLLIERGGLCEEASLEGSLFDAALRDRHHETA